MGISKQDMSSDAFDGNLKKQGPKAVKLNTKNLGFVAFAIVILQVADAGIQWLVGGPASLDTFMYAAVVFIILKCTYTKYHVKDAKATDKGTVNEDEASAELETEEHPATMVRDTMNYTMKIQTFKQAKAPPARKSPPASNSDMQTGANQNWVPAWLKDGMPKQLNARAKKFVPVGPSNTLDSEAPLFLPTSQQVEEYQLLKSEYGGVDTGAVVYRSRHWLNEISPDTKKEVKPSKSKSKSKSPDSYKKKVTKKLLELVPAQKTRKTSKSPEPAPKRKWQEKVNPKDIKWASAWSTFQTACTL